MDSLAREELTVDRFDIMLVGFATGPTADVLIALHTPSLLGSTKSVIKRSRAQSSPALWSCVTRYGQIVKGLWLRVNGLSLLTADEKKKTRRIFCFVIGAEGFHAFKTVTLQQMVIEAQETQKEPQSLQLWSTGSGTTQNRRR